MGGSPDTLRRCMYAVTSTPAAWRLFTPAEKSASEGNSGGQVGSGATTPCMGTATRIGTREAAAATRSQSVVTFAL